MKIKLYFLPILLILGMSSCQKEQGCTNQNACNFNLDAEEDDGSCLFTGQACDDGNENTVNDEINGLCFCQGQQPDAGCMDDQACNYEFDATVDDGSCLFPGDACNDGDPGTIDDVYISNCECQGVTATYGCTDAEACNYDVQANVDDSSCGYPGSPCNDGNAVTIDDTYNANCICEGITPSVGCTDSAACNFNALADTEDGSCAYPGDPCNDGDVNTLDDVWSSSCDCYGTPPSDNSCAVQVDGMIDVYWGVYVDGYPDECTRYIYLEGDPSVQTDVLTSETSNAISAESWNFSPGTWVMVVDDSYGDGKGSGGYYFAQCLTNGDDWVDVFTTPFTTGYTSSTTFTIGDGVVGPNPGTNTDN